MRARAWLALWCCFFLACSKSEKKAAAPCDAAPLADLIQQHPVHVLCGAADFMPGASAIADSMLDPDWNTFDPRSLAERADPVKVSKGIEQMCAMLGALPEAGQRETAAGIVSWVDANFAIDRAHLETPGVEFFASAMTQVPEARPALPEDALARSSPEVDVGETMASTEFTMMEYALTHILARMPVAERDRVLDEIQTRAVELLNRED